MPWGQKLKQRLRRRKKPIKVGVLDGYAHWAENYPATVHNPLMEIEQQAMLSLLPDHLTGKECLDLACGSGRYMRLLQARQAKRVIGLDYSAAMLAQAARPQSEIQNPKLCNAPFFPLPFADRTFDLITCGLAVGHEKNLTQTLAEAARVLCPGGTILYSDLHPCGTLLGWRRTFTAAGGSVFEVEHHLHLYSAHQQACQAAGLLIEAVLEPLMGEHASRDVQNLPAVLVIRAIKPGSRATS